MIGMSYLVFQIYVGAIFEQHLYREFIAVKRRHVQSPVSVLCVHVFNFVCLCVHVCVNRESRCMQSPVSLVCIHMFTLCVVSVLVYMNGETPLHATCVPLWLAYPARVAQCAYHVCLGGVHVRAYGV
jgi:hypothetical protein